MSKTAVTNRPAIPEGYAPLLNLYDTQKAIGLLKRVFEDTLAGNLNLRRVSAPLFVQAATGLNDDLNGVERPVGFDIPAIGGPPGKWSTPWPSGSAWPSSGTASTPATACIPT